MNVWAYISAGVGWDAGGGVGDEHVALLRYSAKVARDRVDVRLSSFSSPFRSCTGGVTFNFARETLRTGASCHVVACDFRVLLLVARSPGFWQQRRGAPTREASPTHENL